LIYYYYCIKYTHNQNKASKSKTALKLLCGYSPLTTGWSCYLSCWQRQKPVRVPSEDWRPWFPSAVEQWQTIWIGTAEVETGSSRNVLRTMKTTSLWRWRSALSAFYTN